MKKIYGKKALLGDRDNISVDKKYIIIFMLVLYILVVALVSLILYKPTVSETTYKTSNSSEYTANEDDKTINEFGANCDKSTLKDLVEQASSVKFNYELTTYDTGIVLSSSDMDGDEGTLEIYAYQLEFSNIGDNISLIVTNDQNDDSLEINKDKLEDKKFTSVFTDIENISTLDIKVYAYNLECSSELVREYTITLPRFNDRSLFMYCDGSEDEECDALTYEEQDTYSPDIASDFDSDSYFSDDEDSGNDTSDSKFTIKLPEFTFINVLWISIVIYLVLLLIVYLIFRFTYMKKRNGGLQ